jgi:cyanate lyase
MGSVFFLNYPDFWLFGHCILSCFNLKYGMWDSKDPEGVAWQCVTASKRFVPLKNQGG